jgi:hypothetical protein
MSVLLVSLQFRFEELKKMSDHFEGDTFVDSEN